MSSVYTPDQLRDLLLEQRGIIDTSEKEKFLNPNYERDISDPFLLNDMDIAVDRLIQALDKKELIMIYADYDADGIPGAAILADFFHTIGHTNFDVYIPHRHSEGYGVHRHAVEKFIEQKVTAMITVDVGISAVDEIAFAQENNIDVLVTDHHEPGDRMVSACAVVNPKLGNYPDRMLCGAAVAWKLVCALLQKLREHSSSDLGNMVREKIPVGWEKWLLDLVGIATLSDMVPLQHENRALAWFGMRVLRKTRRKGLQEIFRALRIDGEHVVEEDITFSLTPRINAASRMAHPRDAYDVLAGTEVSNITASVAHLMQLNEERKRIVAQTVKQAHRMLDERILHERVIVLGHPDWSAGILGLVASSLCEHYQRTVFIWTREEGLIKGSCRSFGGYDVHYIMHALPKDVLIQCGGHKEAGGFTTHQENIYDLESHIINIIENMDTPDFSKVPRYNAEIPLSMVHRHTYQALRTMAPFGEANKQPIFLFRNVTITSVQLFGKHKEHTRFTLSQEKTSCEAITFFATPQHFSREIIPGEKYDLCATIEESRFAGRVTIRLRLIDFI